MIKTTKINNKELITLNYICLIDKIAINSRTDKGEGGGGGGW